MEYVLKLNGEEMQILSAALGELPHKHVHSLVKKIQGQIDAQALKEDTDASL